MVDTSERDRPLSVKWHLHGKALSPGLRHALGLFIMTGFLMFGDKFRRSRTQSSISLGAFKWWIFQTTLRWNRNETASLCLSCARKSNRSHFAQNDTHSATSDRKPFSRRNHSSMFRDACPRRAESQLHVFRAVSHPVFLCRFSAPRAISPPAANLVLSGER